MVKTATTGYRQADPSLLLNRKKNGNKPVLYNASQKATKVSHVSCFVTLHVRKILTESLKSLHFSNTSHLNSISSTILLP